MTNIILCGGSGTRLWPLSRTLMPKQFLKIFDKRSLFQLTLKRNKKFCKDQLIVSNTDQYFLAIDQLEEVKNKNSNFLLEPIGRNTAPAIALSCMSLDKDEIVLVTPSDHLIKDEKEYEKVLAQAQEFAKDDFLVTFGIKPTYPEIGFGYIEGRIEDLGFRNSGMDVIKFHEKPDINTAKKYLSINSKSSNLNPQSYYLWNSGMFMFKAGVFLDELKIYSPDIYEKSLKAFKNAKKEQNIIRINLDDMQHIPEDSIDYAVMEKSKKVKVIPSDISWSDVGSFDALSSELENDKDNNLIISNKRVELIDIEDLIIIDTNDALLISKKGSSQKVKDIVQKLKQEDKELTKVHQTAHRPWGTYEVLFEDKGYKIKRIVVKPGKRLSLQKHFHRNEHWIVVSGTATVTVGNKKHYVRPNESTYIKMGEVHRLENEGKIPVVLIEAQVGEYTGEDDIVRIEDDFRRG